MDSFHNEITLFQSEVILGRFELWAQIWAVACIKSVNLGIILVLVSCCPMKQQTFEVSLGLVKHSSPFRAILCAATNILEDLRPNLRGAVP